MLIFASIHPEILQKHANQCTDIEIDTTMKNNDIETQEEIFIRRKMNRGTENDTDDQKQDQ